MRIRSAHWKKQLDQGFGPKPSDSISIPSIIDIPLSQADSGTEELQMEGHGRKRSVLCVSSSMKSESKKSKSDSKGSKNRPSKSASKSMKTTPLSTTSGQSKPLKSSSKSCSHPTPMKKKDSSRRMGLSSKSSSTKSGKSSTSVQPTFQNPIPLLPRKQVYDLYTILSNPL